MQYIYDGGVLYDTFDGPEDPFSFESTTHQVRLLFTSDSSVTAAGFIAVFYIDLPGGKDIATFFNK